MVQERIKSVYQSVCLSVHPPVRLVCKPAHQIIASVYLWQEHFSSTKKISDHAHTLQNTNERYKLNYCYREGVAVVNQKRELILK